MSFAVEKLKIALRDKVLPGFLLRLYATLRKVPDAHLYNPRFQPWLGLPEFRLAYDEISDRTLINPESAWVLYSLARQAFAVSGDFLEAGVYRGGTARLLREIIDKSGERRILHLLDTFAGMPKTDPAHDIHREKDFSDTTVDAVASFVGKEKWILYRKGYIPDSFKGMEGNRFAFAHIDVDVYKSVLDCCEFIYPRMVCGGVLVFDDYGFPSCPGARAAVDDYFLDKREIPLVLHSGQAIVFRAGAS
jgi:O-methyltransferase